MRITYQIERELLWHESVSANSHTMACQMLDDASIDSDKNYYGATLEVMGKISSMLPDVAEALASAVKVALGSPVPQNMLTVEHQLRTSALAGPTRQKLRNCILMASDFDGDEVLHLMASIDVGNDREAVDTIIERAKIPNHEVWKQVGEPRRMKPVDARLAEKGVWFIQAGSGPVVPFNSFEELEDWRTSRGVSAMGVVEPVSGRTTHAELHSAERAASALALRMPGRAFRIANRLGDYVVEEHIERI